MQLFFQININNSIAASTNTPKPTWTAPSGKNPPTYNQTFNNDSSSSPKPSPSPSTSDAGIPTSTITSDQDQANLDASHSTSTGITFVRTKVLGMRSTYATVTKAPVVTPLTNNGGTLLNQITLYPIWWGPTSFWPTNYQTVVRNALQGMQCSNDSCTQTTSLLNQYFPSTSKASITLGREFFDTSTPPSSSPSTSTLAVEVNKVVTNAALDPKGMYIVFTTNFPRYAGYCAWHSAASISNKWFAFGYMPNLTNQGGCGVDWYSAYSLNNPGLHTLAADSEVNILTHEIYETMTDPMVGNRYGWLDARGSEIGDKCIWLNNTSSVQLNLGVNGTYTVQTEWSNAAWKISGSGCAGS